MPLSVPFVFDIYYKNVDPTLGIQNSTFHFQRSIPMQSSPLCASARFITTTPIDPCLTSRQIFKLPIDSTITIPSPAFDDYYENKPFSETKERDVYFYVQKCADATCTHVVGSDAYVTLVHVKDPETDNRLYPYVRVWGDVITHFRMKFFKVKGDVKLRNLEFAARTAGTYRIRGFYKSTKPADGFPNNYELPEIFVTVPQKGGDATCLSSGKDGAYKTKWDGCKENHNPQSLEFEAIDERYGFLSNYSNKRLVFNFNPSISTVPVAGNISELYCDWQVLADGYSASGAVCKPDRIELPPMTRAIVKGGRIYISKRPPMKDGPNQFEYIMAYQRTTNKDNMNLFIDVQYVECPMEAIPETGYSLRSPAPLAQGDGSFIFTGNSLQIPAIGLGMDGGVPIVHLNYRDGTLESGWNLKMLGGYIGELEGGAYLPYAGNSVLTGHYYSQGVFVNLVNLRLEDEIIVFGNDGMKYTYSVTNSYWTQPTDVYQMFQPNGDRSLTLVTCDDYNFITDKYQKRYIVQATLVNSEPYLP
jgi:LPXTG-site transpeptidase (sortase) family protein